VVLNKTVKDKKNNVTLNVTLKQIYARRNTNHLND